MVLSRLRLTAPMWLTVFGVCATLSLQHARAQSDLPPKVQADLLNSEIIRAVRRNDAQAVLDNMDQYRALKLPIPPPLLFVEAQAAAKRHANLRAYTSLRDYLAHASGHGAEYQKALALYPRYQRAAEPELKAQAAAQAAAQAKLDAIAPGMALVSIPAGSFQMGDSVGGGDADERPVHTVTVRAFKLMKYDVTFEQYDAFARATNRALPDDNNFGRGNRPVINLSWDDAEAYATWVSEQLGLHFRLPTEAEWEYAARAGTTTAYYWGDGFDDSRANKNGSGTTPVGQYPPNPWGLYDMSGNVWQWVQDCYHGSYAGAPSDGSAWTSGDCTRRVFRGGSWSYVPKDLRVSFRYWYAAATRNIHLGFRLAQAE